MKRNMVAFDCGNSSCRVILGVYDGEQITTEVISQITWSGSISIFTGIY